MRVFLIILFLFSVTPTFAELSQGSLKEVIKYDPQGRRDPFLSIIELTKAKMKKRVRRSLNPLESYDVTDIKLLGIVYNGKEYFASILLPNGKAFTVKEGMKIGLYGGKIIKLTQDTMVVREMIMDYKGKFKPKDIILKLHQEEE